MNIVKVGIIFLCFFFSLNCFEKKDAEKDVFGRWIKIQRVFSDINISSMKKYVGVDLLSNLKNKCCLLVNQIKTMAIFYNFFSDQELLMLLDLGEKFSNNSEIKNKLLVIYDLLQDDIDGFVKLLSSIGFSSSVFNVEEEEIGSSFIIDKYISIFDSLFDQKDDLKKYQFLFATANRFYEYCFSPKTFSSFNSLISDYDRHPIARLFYSIIWSYLAGQGWKFWHQSSIDELKKCAYKGKEIVYIAGGSDIYQLIKNGIYSIRIIDPLLPSQPKYYSEGWNWLCMGNSKTGGIGDELEFSFSDKMILMKRTMFEKKDETFKAQLSTDYISNITKSITTWDLFDGKTNKKLGSIIFDRRFVNQKDFEIKENQQLLISFNELHFITKPDSFGGWGVNPYKFDENLSIIVKQLSKPITAKMVQNMRKVIEEQKFRFTELGTCVT